MVFLQSLAQQLLPTLTDVLTAAAMALMAIIATWVRAHTKNTTLLGIEQRASAAVLTAVQAVEQLAQRDLKNGITAKSAGQLKADALALAKTLLGPAGVAELANIVGLEQLEATLSGKVEAAVLVVNAPAVPVAIVSEPAKAGA